MGGLKGNPFIVAVNKNPMAPIFLVVSVGVVADVLEFIPVLKETVESTKQWDLYRVKCSEQGSEGWPS